MKSLLSSIRRIPAQAETPETPSPAAPGDLLDAAEIERMLAGETGAPPHSNCPPQPHRQVTVETMEKNGRIAKIIVTCRCGEKIEIDCLY